MPTLEDHYRLEELTMRKGRRPLSPDELEEYRRLFAAEAATKYPSVPRLSPEERRAIDNQREKCNYDIANTRRHELIDKKYEEGGLTPDEKKELKKITESCRAFIDKYFPFPDELEEGSLPYKMAQLEKKLKAEGKED